jgi:hypothetical protein
MLRRIAYHPFFIKLFNWEYWPFHVVYGPIYLYFIFLCLRARSFFFFNTSNPAIKNGGFMMESKKEIYDLIPEQYYPPTLFFSHHSPWEDILNKVKERRFRFPMIGKPDIGQKGMSVKKLENETDLVEYAENSKVDFLIQEFIPFKNEVGIFYYRFPHEKRGRLSGIVRKEFLAVTGNGYSTVEDLLKQDKRYVLQLPVLRKTYSDKLGLLLKPGEEFLLVPYGNHVRGAKFIDDSHLIDEELTAAIDTVCRQVTGFYYGRLDIRYNTWEELKQGKNFSVIELNGAGSEPTHMYDPKHSIFFAWKEIIRHWNILFRISRMNHHPVDRPYMNLSTGLEMFRENSKYLKLIEGK